MVEAIMREGLDDLLACAETIPHYSIAKAGHRERRMRVPARPDPDPSHSD